MLLNLEVFMYASSLDLNIGYYQIEVSLGAKQVYTIVLIWGEADYPKLPFGIFNIPDIFKENMHELFEVFDMGRAYIYDVLVITKDSLRTL